MKTLTKTISSTAIAGAAATVALVLVSAPAASSPDATRPLLSGAAARTAPPQVTNSGALRWSPASSEATIRITARGESLGVASANVLDRRTRVVVESHDPELARSSIRALGGRIERSAGRLVQALVATEKLPTLSRRPGVDRVRAPYTRVESGLSGEEVGVALAAAWHAKGFTGKGVKVAIVDGGFKGLAERQAAGDLPANAITQDYCGGHIGEEDHGTAV